LSGMHVGDEHYGRLFEAMLEGFAYCRMIFDDDGAPVDFEYLDVNDAFARLTGLQDVEGRLVSEVIPGLRDTNPDLFETYGRVVTTGEPLEFDTDIETLGLHLHISVYRPEPGHFAALFDDITERKLAERVLRDSEERFEALFNQAPLGYQSLDEDGRFIEVNERWLDTLGYSREEVIGAWFGDFLAPEFVEPFRERFPMFKARGAVHSEFEMVRKDGARRAIAFEGRIGHNPDGTFKQTHCILSDVTESRLGEQALRLSEERLRRSIQDAPVPVMIHSEDGEVIQISREWERVTGYSLDDIPTTADWTERAYGSRAEMVRDDIEGLYGLDAPKDEGEYVVRTKDGSNRVWYFRSSPLGAAADGRRTVISTALDVTERRKAEDEVLRLNADLERRVQARTEELEAANEELLRANENLAETNIKLEEATRAKNDFLASMSHELRTPLNSIIGFSGILSQELAGPLNEEQHKQVGMINNSGRLLLELVNEVLDLARVESARNKPTFSEVDVASIAREMLETVRPMAEAKGLETEWVSPLDLRPVVTDGLRVGQIVLNLVGNAVKFTDAGGVTATVTQDDSSVTVTVKDTGRGIAAGHLERVFDDFYQVEPHSSARSQGTGLGLSVCRRLAESIGADIGVTSELGRGSVFTLRIPDAGH
jgi:PAS domain S-box-containing protein